MSAIVRVTDLPYQIIVPNPYHRTGEKDGLKNIATMSNDPLKSLQLQLDFSPLPGPDTWRCNVRGLLPATWGKWEMDETQWPFKAAFLSGHGIGRFLVLNADPHANGDPNDWRSWPHNPFRKGQTGRGQRLGIDSKEWTRSSKPRPDLHPSFAWECLSDDSAQFLE
jgi:hypothetical protein